MGFRKCNSNARKTKAKSTRMIAKRPKAKTEENEK